MEQQNGFADLDGQNLPSAGAVDLSVLKNADKYNVDLKVEQEFVNWE